MSETGEKETQLPENAGLSDEEALRRIAALPPHERSLIHGVALRVNGYSLRKAGEIAGCNPQTLWRWEGKLGVTSHDMNEIAVKASELAFAIQDEAGKQTQEALRDGKIQDAQLPIVWGIAMDKLTRLQQIGRTEHDGAALESILSKLGHALEGKRIGLTIESESPDSQSIDVTPIPEET